MQIDRGVSGNSIIYVKMYKWFNFYSKLIKSLAFKILVILVTINIILLENKDESKKNMPYYKRSHFIN